MFINDKQSTGRISRVVEITPLSPKQKLSELKKYENIIKKKKTCKKIINLFKI